MNLRNLSISVALLVLLCGVVWFARRPQPPASADPRVDQPLLAGEVATQATKVTIADAGRSVEITRGSDGIWTVPSYHDLPADFSKLSRLISDLSETKIRRLVTSRPESLARLEFKDSSIRLADAADKELWKLTLGKSADGGGRFIRFGEESKGYLAPLSIWLDAEPKSWADPVLLDLKASDISRLEINFADGDPVVAARETADSAWTSPSTPEGQRLKPDRVDAALSGILTLRFTETFAPDDDKVTVAAPHSRTLKLATFNNQTYTLTFSRKPEEKRPKAPTTSAEDSNSSDATTSTPATDPEPATTAAVTDPAKPSEPEMETIPAGPVFVRIESSDSSARINAMIAKRAFQIGEWTYTGLPKSNAEFWEAVPAEPAPTPETTSESKPVETTAADPAK